MNEKPERLMAYSEPMEDMPPLDQALAEAKYVIALGEDRQESRPADSRQPAYDAVYALIRQWGTPVSYNAYIWRAVTAALDAIDERDLSEREADANALTAYRDMLGKDS